MLAEDDRASFTWPPIASLIRVGLPTESENAGTRAFFAGQSIMTVFNLVRRVIAGGKYRLVAQKLKHCGTGVEIDFPVTFVFPERIAVGKHVYIGPNSCLNGRGGLTIGDHSILGPEIAIMSATHNHRLAKMVPYDGVELLYPVTIGQCVWIGLRAIIMPGITLGEGSIVGAGSVVTKSFAPGSIIAGNPAAMIGQRDMQHYQKCVDSNAFYLRLKQTIRFCKDEKYSKKGP